MEPEHFNGLSGKAVQSSKGIYYTFTPNLLPPTLKYDDELINLLAEANLALGKLGGLGYLYSNPKLFKLLVGPYLRREAVLSSKIEGTRSSLSDVLLFEAKEESEANPDLQEVMNYIECLEVNVEKIKTNELDLELVLAMHKILLRGVRGENKNPGSIRHLQNWIGKSGSSLLDATYVPPEPQEVPRLLENLFTYLNAEDSTNPLIKIGLAHYQFEAVHPFRDGNGRLGRLIIILYIVKKKLLPHPLLYLSAYFESNRQTYYDLLLKVSEKGAFEEWLKFFLKGIIAQSNDAVMRTRKLSDYINGCKAKATHSRNASNLITILDHLSANPYITVPAAAGLLNKTYPSAERTITELVSLGILEETTGKTRSRVFLAHEIIRIIQ